MSFFPSPIHHLFVSAPSFPMGRVCIYRCHGCWKYPIAASAAAADFFLFLALTKNRHCIFSFEILLEVWFGFGLPGCSCRFSFFFLLFFFFRLFFSAIAGIPLYMWRGTYGIIVLSNNFSCYFHTHARARQWKAALNGENAQRAQPAKNKKKQTRHTQMLVWRSTKKTKKKAIGKSARGATPPKSSEKTKKKW